MNRFRPHALIVLLLLTCAGMATGLQAALAPATEAAARLELIVIEVKGCKICALVRDEIQPAYERTPRAREVPLRYLDITSVDETRLGLIAPVDVVPTIVLMRDGQEVDRVSGYTGPKNFLEAIAAMVRDIE